jgi:hypothetical protein
MNYTLKSPTWKALELFQEFPVWLMMLNTTQRENRALRQDIMHLKRLYRKYLRERNMTVTEEGSRVHEDKKLRPARWEPEMLPHWLFSVSIFHCEPWKNSVIDVWCILSHFWIYMTVYNQCLNLGLERSFHAPIEALIWAQLGNLKASISEHLHLLIRYFSYDLQNF